MKSINRFLFVIVFVASAFFFISCEQITEPTENTAVDKTANQTLNKVNPERPIYGNILYTLITPGEPSIYSGTGNVTHLGNCSVYDETYEAAFPLITGDDWFTAANGSKIHMTWQMDYYNPSAWVWQIIGGTGRFDGATGDGTLTAEFTPSGDLAVTFTGTITY